MGRPKKSVPVHVEPEEISQEEPEEEPEADDDEEAVTEFNREHAEPAPAGGTVKKAEAVRRAIAAGHDSPEDGVAYLKKHFGIEMTKQVFSSNKAQQKSRDKKQAETGSPAPRTQAAPAAPAAPRQAAPVPKAPAPAAPASGIIGDIADIKRLLATHGKDGLEELINVLG